MLATTSRAEMSALARIADSLGPTAPPAVCRVKFRTLARADGATERWRQPRLAPWEVPRREPRPNAPDVAMRRRAVRQPWLARRLNCADARIAAPARCGARVP